jgi:hypothetical protein
MVIESRQIMTSKKAVERGKERARQELARIREQMDHNPRAARAMLESAERRGVIEPCDKCGEPTSLVALRGDTEPRGRATFRSGGKVDEVVCQPCWISYRRKHGMTGRGRVENAAGRLLNKRPGTRS